MFTSLNTGPDREPMDPGALQNYWNGPYQPDLLSWQNFLVFGMTLAPFLNHAPDWFLQCC